MSTVEVGGLFKRFGETIAVDDVSFKMGNEIVALLGPSGCGKTTTLRCVAGLERPDKGEISIMGQVVTDPEKGIFIPPEKRKLGMVFQSYALWPHMSVYDNVVYGLKEFKKLAKGETEAKVKEALRLVDLEGLEKRYPAQLSGGQQQRVALARSIVYEPQVLLLDEPLSNLDFKLREKTRGELRSLLKKIGIASVYVTHDQEEAFIISDRIIVMDKGHIIQRGKPAEIYSRPANEFVASFIGRANMLTAVVADKPPLGEMGTVKIHEFADLPLMCWVPEDFKVGDRCLLIVRSNEVGLFDHKPRGKENIIEGRVLRREFRGPVTDHLIEVCDTSLIVTTHRFCPHASASDDSVDLYIAIPPNAIILVPMKQDR